MQFPPTTPQSSGGRTHAVLGGFAGLQFTPTKHHAALHVPRCQIWPCAPTKGGKRPTRRWSVLGGLIVFGAVVGFVALVVRRFLVTLGDVELLQGGVRGGLLRGAFRVAAATRQNLRA